MGLVMLPLLNFYNFLQLASRVIRVLFHYCDDYVSGQCMVTATPAWSGLMHALAIIAATITLLHISLPLGADEDKRLDGPVAEPTSTPTPMTYMPLSRSLSYGKTAMDAQATTLSVSGE